MKQISVFCKMCTGMLSMSIDKHLKQDFDELKRRLEKLE